MSLGARLSPRLPWYVAYRTMATATSSPISSQTPSSLPLKNTTMPSSSPAEIKGGLSPPKWKTVEPLPLTRESFLGVLEGHSPLILERGFLSKDKAQAFTDVIGPKISPYLHVAGPQMKRLGVAQFEFQAQSADDFKTRGTDREFAPVYYMNYINRRILS